ncbi:MAG: tetratricopeptide repeat protein [Planctomycetota bacterium]|jgi:hypothetical protein
MNRIARLQAKLTKAEYGSRERVDLLNQIGYQAATFDLNRTKKVVDEAYGLAKKLDYEKGILYARCNQAMVLYLTQFPEKAERLFLEVLDAFKKSDEKVGMANALFFLGLMYWGYGEIEKGFEYTTESLRICQECGYTYGEVRIPVKTATHSGLKFTTFFL